MFMKHFESMAIEQAADKPSFWVHYMDDTFVIWPHDERKLEKFLELLSTQRDPIEFTTELESDGVIPFLDINVRREKGRLRTSVHRKKTHTDRYLHFNSNHYPQTKTGIISCLRDRAEKIHDETSLKDELRHLEKVFVQNGYSRSLTQCVLRKRSG